MLMPGAPRPGIVLESVSYAYADRKSPVPAVDDVSLTLTRGELGILVGPSGCGKSTLLRLVAGLAEPSSGRLSFAGASIHNLRSERRIGFAFQDPGLLPWRTVRRNIELPFDLSGLPKDRQWVDHLLDITHLGDWAGHRPRQLSGGMRQRVALARALATRPDVLLLDEPFGALDEITRAELNVELLNIVSDTATTGLLVTHSVEEAVLLGDEVIVLGPRPCQVRGRYRIDIPRDQRRDSRDTARFSEYCREIRASLEAR
ncbi:MAG TPA: ABC transporter ATP-binding protein [Candidatus Acidoferrum sp.]|nr:ABC transporter ATP-binding protein [Candidatus Acidoferrum sp.]